MQPTNSIDNVMEAIVFLASMLTCALLVATGHDPDGVFKSSLISIFGVVFLRHSRGVMSPKRSSDPRVVMVAPLPAAPAAAPAAPFAVPPPLPDPPTK